MNIQHKKFIKIVDDLYKTAEAYKKRTETDHDQYLEQLTTRLNGYVSMLNKLKIEIEDISKSKQRSRHRFVVVYEGSLKEDVKKKVVNRDGTTVPCYWGYDYVGTVEIENGLLTTEEIFEDVSVALDINIALEEPTGNYARINYQDRIDDDGNRFKFFDRTNGCYIAAIGYNKQYTEKEMKNYAKTNSRPR